MTDQHIKSLAIKYRNAIDAARCKGVLAGFGGFDDFPTGCCGVASYLLAEYLRRNGVETIWCSTRRGEWTHAWLVIKDRRVNKPTTYSFSLPEELKDTLVNYGIQQLEDLVNNVRYEAKDLENGLVIDITGDQFEDYDITVYVGTIDAFHQSFDFIQAVDFDVLDDNRNCLYKIIEQFL